jgi:hypothetical protein
MGVSAVKERKGKREKDEQVVAPNVHPPFMHRWLCGGCGRAVLMESEDCSSRKNESQPKGEWRRKRKERTDLGVSGNAVALALAAMEEVTREGGAFPRFGGAEERPAVLPKSRSTRGKGQRQERHWRTQEGEKGETHFSSLPASEDLLLRWKDNLDRQLDGRFLRRNDVGGRDFLSFAAEVGDRADAFAGGVELGEPGCGVSADGRSLQGWGEVKRWKREGRKDSQYVTEKEWKGYAL